MAMLQIKLDAKQQLRWDETRAAMTVAAPHFTHLLYTLLDNTYNKSHAFFTSQIPVAATDAKVILLNPDNYFKRPLSERVFILGHELMHNVYNDVVLLHYFNNMGKVLTSGGKALPFVNEIFQISADLRINDGLVQAKLGTMPPDGVWDPSRGSHRESLVDIYEKEFNTAVRRGKGRKPGDKPGDQPGGGGNSGDQPGDGQGGFDIILKPGESGVGGKNPTDTAQERDNDQEIWDREIKIAANLARSQGRLPACLEHIFGEITTHKVPWEDHLEAEMARAFGGGSYNWKRPDRGFIVRDIYVPGRSGFVCDLVIVAGDTSGSITHEEIDIGFTETQGILETLRPKRIILIWCDAAVQRVDEITDVEDMAAIRHKGAPKGGGTSFKPVFEWIEQEGLEPDALVYFTDGYGSFPHRAPTYPVIWGSVLTGPSPVDYPFGKCIDIPRA